MLDKNNMVVKSKQLIESRFPDWDAGTLNLFDTYLSRINPLDPSSSEVCFTKREYEKVIGVTELRPKQLNKSVRKFIANTVAIPLPSGGWDNWALFDRAKVDKNESGEWYVLLRCHPELKELFFDLKKYGYQKFKLEYTLKLKHKTSKLLYYYLKDNQYKVSWVVELPELRERLGATAKMYDAFKDFNKFVLKRAQEEINPNTDINFSYEKIMRGRLTRAVKFTVEPSESQVVFVEEEQIEGQIGLFDTEEEKLANWKKTVPVGEDEKLVSEVEMYASACDYEFDYKDMVFIKAKIPGYVDMRENLTGGFAPEISRTDYLSEKYTVLNRKENVKKRLSMYISIVENDWDK